MTPDLAVVLALLAGAVIMFAVNRPRMDAVALLMMVALPLAGVVGVDEALAGFSDPNVVLIAGLFVIGESLVRTGVAQRLGDALMARAGGSETSLMVLLMAAVAGIGSLMSSTAVVAIFVPVVLRIARTAGLPASRLMMPLSVAALLSGMMTLVATPPNLVVHGELVRRGFAGFHFFSFTPFGVPLLALSIVYMLVARRWLTRRPPAGDGRRRLSPLASWIAEYGLAAREHRLRVLADSPMAGHPLQDLQLRGSAGVNIVAIERSGRFANQMLRPVATTVLRAGDVLFIDLFASTVDIDEVCRRFRLERLPYSGAYFSDRSQDIGMAEVMIPAASTLAGQTVVGARFRSEYDLSVVGLRRGIVPITTSVLGETLRVGDTLLVVGAWRDIRRIASSWGDLILLNVPAEWEDVAPARARAPQALAVLAAVIVLMAGGVVPNVLAVVMGCLALGWLGCVDFSSAYRAIHWQSLILIVGMMPFAVALEKTGGIDLAAGALLGMLEGLGPRAVLAGLFVLTAGLGVFISNTATAVLMAPVAMAVADALQASPYPFAMIVALAASSAFMAPMSSPVNALVLGPGNYTFVDFLRVGVPLAVIVLVAAVILVPMVLPL